MSLKQRWLHAAGAIAISTYITTASISQTTYEVVEIVGPAGIRFGGLPKVNDNGLVAATYLRTNDDQDVFLFDWETQQATALPHLDNDRAALAADLNNAGQVVGWSRPSRSATAGMDAVLWENGQATALGLAGGEWSRAQAINENGVIVGNYLKSFAEFSRAVTHGVIYDHGTIHRIEPSGFGTDGVPLVNDINDSEQVAATSAFDWDHTSNWVGIIYDRLNGQRSIGRINGNSSNANGINNHGVIVGAADTAVQHETIPDTFHVQAMKWEDGVLTHLGTLGGVSSFADEINDNGDIVGTSQIEAGDNHATLWTDGQIIDLNNQIPENSGWALTRATDINSNGWIACEGIKEDIPFRMVLLIPIEQRMPLML